MMLSMWEAERALLGAMLHDESAVAMAEVIVQPDCFQKFEHQLIYLGLRAGRNADGLETWLLSRGLLWRVGGPDYIEQLLNTVSGSANVMHWAQLVRSGTDA